MVCVVGAGCAGARTYRDVLNEELKEAVDGAGEHSLDRHVRQAAAVAAAAGAGAGVASSSSGSIIMTKKEVRFGKEGRESE